MTVKEFIKKNKLSFGKGKDVEACEAKTRCYKDFKTDKLTDEKMVYLFFNHAVEFGAVKDIEVMTLSRTAAASVRKGEHLGELVLHISDDEDAVFIQMPATRNVLEDIEL